MLRNVAVLLFSWALVSASSVNAAADSLLDFAIPSGVKAGVMVDSGASAGASNFADIAFDIDPDGLPSVAEGASLRIFGSSQELLALNTPRIDDFAWMRDGKLLLVTQGHLATVSPEGIVLSLALPVADMHVRPAGPETAYLFGGKGPSVNHSVYLFSRDGKIAKLIDLPAAIRSVAGDGNNSYVAVENTILRFAINEPVRAVLKTRDPVLSIESAPNDAIFYSTKSSVGYADRFGRAFEFIRGDGGLLRARGTKLFVLLSDGMLLRLGPTDKFTAALASLDDEISSKPDNEAIINAGLIAELEDRLYELNFDPARRDGGLDDETEAVIRQFEQMSGRRSTGKVTYGLLKSLRAAGSRAPWGAIVYAKASGKWGMSWSNETRKGAVAKAIASCGDASQCISELSFYGKGCGAFAYSEKEWAITARHDIENSRAAALTDCQKYGNKCQMIATVCADGSNHWQAGQ
jgi:hypothetical protein